jgi:hypothetical protein
MIQQFPPYAKHGTASRQRSVTIHGNLWNIIANSKKDIKIDWCHAKLDNPNPKT